MASVIKKGKERSRGHPAADGPKESEVRARADDIVRQAKAAAAAMIEEATGDVASSIAEANEQGQREGFQQAEHMREQIGGMEQRMLKEVEGEVVRAALQIAEELLVADMAERPDAIVDLAVAALKTAQDSRDVFLRVHPSQARILRDNRARLVDTLSMAREVDVKEDRKVTPGGVLIQTESGVIDAQLETQLAEIARVLGA